MQRLTRLGDGIKYNTRMEKHVFHSFRIPPRNFKKPLLSFFCKALKDIFGLGDALLVPQKDLWERKMFSVNKHNYSCLFKKKNTFINN